MADAPGDFFDSLGLPDEEEVQVSEPLVTALEEDESPLGHGQVEELDEKMPIVEHGNTKSNWRYDGLRFRRRGSNRLGRWSWLEPAPLIRVPDFQVATVQEEIIVRGAAEDLKYEQELTPQSLQQYLLVETLHEQLERQKACEHLTKALAERFGCAEDSKQQLEELLASKVAEVSQLQEELSVLRDEKDALASALESCEKQVKQERARANAAAAAAGAAAAETAAMDATRREASPVSPQLPESPAESTADDTPKGQVESIRRERLEGIRSPIMRDMFLGCVELLAADIYSSRAHFVLELLQNADDNEFNCTGSDKPTARFLLSGGSQDGAQCPYIAVVNNEVGLNAQDVAGMCAISKSSKKDKADRTGKKGIGFKSVFAVSSCPSVLSRGYTFQFNVVEDRMGYVTPTWIEDVSNCVPQELVDLHQAGLTVIYLPLAPGTQSSALLAEVETSMESLDAATLLFMRRLERIEFRKTNGRLTTMSLERPGHELETVHLEKVIVDTDHDVSSDVSSTRCCYEFFVSSQTVKCNGPPGESAQKRALSLALPVAVKDGSFVLPQRAFATLPLCHTGLCVALNADWDVSASRDGIHENAHNEEIVSQLAQAFASTVAKLGTRWLPVAPIDYLGDRQPLSRFWRSVRDKFIETLLETDVPCVAADCPEDEDGEGLGRCFVPVSQALRRPAFASSAAEKDAASLVSARILKQALGLRFAQEPLPQGLQLESFSAGHYVSCLPCLVESAMGLSSFCERVEQLCKTYRVLQNLLEEPALSISGNSSASLLQRADLARKACCWPLILAEPGQSHAVCASQYGPTFVASEVTDAATAMLPRNQEEAKQRWRLRVLAPEAQAALDQAGAGLVQICSLRACAQRAHVVGLCLELHANAGGSSEESRPSSFVWWASLQFVRDSWEISDMQGSHETHAAAADAHDLLVDQGNELLCDTKRLQSIILLPSQSGDLLHGPSLACPVLLGDRMDAETSQASLPIACLPEGLERNQHALLQTLRWEHFFVDGLGVQSSVGSLQMPHLTGQAHSLASQLLNPDWWLGIVLAGGTEAESLVCKLLVLYATHLKLLPCSKYPPWQLHECMSADFAPFLQGAELLTSIHGNASRLPRTALPPLLEVPASAFTPFARNCLRELGVKLQVSDCQTIFSTCLDPLISARSQGCQVPPTNFAMIYAQIQRLGSGCSADDIDALRARIFIPGLGCVSPTTCAYLPVNLAGLAALLGKQDLQPWYPGLEDLFLKQLGFQGSLDASECIEALRSLRRKDSQDGTLDLACRAYFQIVEDLQQNARETVSMQSQFREEPLLFLPKRIGAAWLPAQKCMWPDVPSGIEIALSSLSSNYPPALESFFVEIAGAVWLNSEEVQARLRGIARQAEQPKLATAYADLAAFYTHSVRKLGLDDSMIQLKADLAGLLFLPGIPDPVSPEDCVFLRDGAEGLAKSCGKLDVGEHFPDHEGYFVGILGLPDMLTTDQCLHALRLLRDSKSEQLSNSVQAAFAAYSYLEDTYGSSMQAIDLSILFQEEALLVSLPDSAPITGSEGVSRRKTPDASSPWRRVAGCMWYDAPAGVQGSSFALDRVMPSNLETFLTEILGVPALDADEVSARMDLLRQTSPCEEALVTAYLQLLHVLDRRNGRDLRFYNSKLLKLLRQRIYLPSIGFVDASICTWRLTSTMPDIRNLNERHDLGDIYGSEGSWSSHALKLQRYFVSWLGVSTALTPAECLRGIRALKDRSVKARQSHGDSGDGEGSTWIQCAKRLYQEMAIAMTHSCTSAAVVEEAKLAFHKERLLLVPGEGANGWFTVDQCIWRLPDTAPEDWACARHELVSHYEEDLRLQRFFTESLGVPFSVRFQNSSKADAVAVQGQPVWLREDADSKPLVSQPRTMELADLEMMDDDGVEGSDDDQIMHFESAAQDEALAFEDRELAMENNPKGELQEGEEMNEQDIVEFASRDFGADESEVQTGIPPPPQPYEPSVQVRGVASDGRRQRKRMLERLASSVMSCTENRQLISSASQVQVRHPEACVDCNPKHDLYKVGVLESRTNVFGATQTGSIPVWVETQGKDLAVERLKAARAAGSLEKFAELLLAISSLFGVPCQAGVHIFEEDTQTVAFNGGGLFFNLRYFVQESHGSSWEDAVSFWTISFAHELAHFDSPVHDRQHGRAMEMSQRAILPGLPQILARPWGAGIGSLAAGSVERKPEWQFKSMDGGLL